MARRPHLLLSLLTASALIAGACSRGDDASEGAQTPQEPTPTTVASDATTTSTTEATTTTLQRLAPGPGGDEVGDPLFAGLGNSGYDALSYDITLNLTGEELRATTVVVLEPTVPLNEFNLDLVGMEVDRVTVNSQAANFTRTGRELVITPAANIPLGTRATVTVEYRGTPTTIEDPSGPIDLGWHTESWGTFVASEPLGGATWFPSNDHPSDKATFRITVTVPAGQVAAGPGVLIDRQDTSEASTFVWQMSDPMATYLASVVTGDFAISTSSGPDAVTIRNVLPTDDAARLLPALSSTNEMLEEFSRIFGPYPFESYGVVAIPQPLTFALENQTLSLFDTQFLTLRRRTVENVLAHELAHQWFGNHVSPAEWDEIWLNEGFASWADHYWTELDGGTTFEERAERARPLNLRPPTEVTPATMFDATVYLRGALTLEALRRTIGDGNFFQLLQAWSDTYGGSSATTEDLLDLIREREGAEAAAVVRAWAFDDIMPELPPRLG